VDGANAFALELVADYNTRFARCMPADLARWRRCRATQRPSPPSPCCQRCPRRVQQRRRTRRPGHLQAGINALTLFRPVSR